MSLWPNPIPPVPFLRERYPLSGVSLPSVFTTVLWSVVMAVISVTVIAPIMDKIVLRLINIITPFFVPHTGELKTQRQAIERLAYQTAVIIGHLLILWPVLLAIFVSSVEGFAWVMGFESPRWIPYIWFFAEMFMGNSLFTYYKDFPKMVLQFGQLRENELFQSTERLLKRRDGPRYVITDGLAVRLTKFCRPWSFSRTLGYDRYDCEITLNFDPERQFRTSFHSKHTTTMTRLRTLGLESIAAFITFIADRSSNITCASPEKFWAQCGPMMRLGVPVGAPIVAFITVITIEWRAERKAAKRGNEPGWAPRLCQRELRRRANKLWAQIRDWRDVWRDESAMQEGGLLWGCPSRPDLRQMEAWTRQS